VPDSQESDCSEESQEAKSSSPNVTLDSSDDNTSSMIATQQSSSPESKETSTQPVNDESSDVSVMKLKKSAYGQRVYNKKQYCFSCQKPFSKMARHLAQVHKNEIEGARALSFPKGSKERKVNLDILRNRGNREHNIKVLKAGKGVLVRRQQTAAKHVGVKDYMHCLHCHGLFRRQSLWRHMQRCNLARKGQLTKPGRSRVQALCAYAQPVPEGVSKKLWKLISDMKQDEITQAVKSDVCIIKFGEHLCNKMGSDKTKHEYIGTKMREARRLLVSAKKTATLHGKDFFTPSNFYCFIQAVKVTAGIQEDEEVYKVPSLALKLGHPLKRMADIAECEAMMAGEEDNIKNVKRFKELYTTKWNECLTASALKTLRQAKWNCPELLPFTEDVKKMHVHLNNKSKLYQEKLKSEKNQKNWSQLAKATLCDLILFNRRRPGEVSKLKLNTYLLRNTSVVHSDVADALSEVEKKLCQHFQRIEIRGKRDRKVPIALTPGMLDSM
jgi:hypothetical protein